MATTTPLREKGRRKRSRPTKVVILKQNISLKDPDIVSRWSSVGTSKGLKTDTEIATFLLSVYDERREESREGIDQRCHCKGPITLVCLNCRRLPFSGSSPSTEEQPAVSLTPLPAKQRAAANSASKPALRKVRAGPRVKSKKEQNAACDSINIKQEQTDGVVADGVVAEDAERKTNSINSDGLNSVGSVTSDIEDNDNQSDEDGGDSERESFDVENESATEDAGQDEESKAGEDPEAAADGKKKKRSGKKAFVCPLCRVVFSTNAQCKTHIGEHEGYAADEKGAYNCSACLKAFGDFESLYKHVRLTEAQQMCGECQHVFTARCQIARHAAEHQSRFCARCDKSFPAMTGAGFLRHVRAHERAGVGDPKPTAFLCPQCGKVYKTSFDLKAHMTYHQKDSPFRCSFPPCPKAFKNKNCQRQHELTHKEKSQQCEVCGAKFLRKCQLTRHMQTHFGKRFQCAECQRKYYSAGELERHTLIVHQGVVTMQKHMRIPSAERRFQCQECQASFSVKATLVKHMRRHTGEKPYTCDDCNQKYSCLASYKRHRQRYHSDTLLTCHCGLKFAAETSLAFHVRMYHDDMVVKGCGPVISQKVDSLRVEKADSRMDLDGGVSSDALVKDGDPISGQKGDSVLENSESRIFYNAVPDMQQH